MQKRQPGGGRVLCVESLGWAGAAHGVDQAVDGVRVSYSLEAADALQLLSHVQWADWDREGHLLIATRDGRLQAWDLDGARSHPLFEEDLARLEPKATPAPAWARQW
jgi:hypothetical protein